MLPGDGYEFTETAAKGHSGRNLKTRVMYTHTVRTPVFLSSHIIRFEKVCDFAGGAGHSFGGLVTGLECVD